MSLKKISSKERFVYAYDEDTEFYYRRAKQSEITNLQKANRINGKPNPDAVARDLLQLCVIDWNDGYHDDENKKVPFSKEEILELPADVQGRLVELILNSRGVEKKRKG